MLANPYGALTRVISRERGEVATHKAGEPKRPLREWTCEDLENDYNEHTEAMDFLEDYLKACKHGLNNCTDELRAAALHGYDLQKAAALEIWHECKSRCGELNQCDFCDCPPKIV